MKEIINKGIVAIIPQYISNKGDCTVIYTKESEPLIIERSMRSVLNRLFKYYMIDLKETKKSYIDLVGSPNSIPLPLNKEDVLFPLKTRKPFSKNDGAIGYFNIRYLKSHDGNGKTTTIHLENDTKIECLYSEATVIKHIKNAKLVSKYYEGQFMHVAEKEVIYNGKTPIVILYEKD